MIGIEEKEMVLKLVPFFCSNPLILDCGSNKGGFSDVILEELSDKCSIHLFEPNTKMLSFCEVKYEYKKNIIYNNEALYRFDGMMDFFYFENENNELSSLVDGGEEWEGLPKKKKQVRINTVDKYCETNNINFIDCLKIDCEGTDPDVLVGAKRMIAEGKIKFILLEYSPHYKRSNNNFKSVIDVAIYNGYKVYSYTASNYFEVKPETFIEDYRFENFVITKENIHNYSVGWNNEFIVNTFDLGKFDFILEVGNFEGLNSKYICENLLNKGGRLICVDPLEDFYTKEDTEHVQEFKQQYQRFIGNTRGLPVELKRGYSQVELPLLNALRFDLSYVDANHGENEVYHDLVWAHAITKRGSYILADDYGWREQTKNGIDKFLNEFSGSIEIISKGYQVLIKKIHDQYTSITQPYY